MSSGRLSASYARAARAFEAGDLGLAESICGQLLKRNNRDVDAMQLRGAIALARQAYDEARSYYQKCLSLRPREPLFHLQAGKVDALQGRFEAAVRWYDTALGLRPGDPQAAAWKAKVLEWAGDYDRARSVLAAFVTAGNETTSMAGVQAKLDMHAGRYAEAVAMTRRHLDRSDLSGPDRHRIAHIAGRAHEKLGEFDDAFRAHSEANRAVARHFDADAHVKSTDRLIDSYSQPQLTDLPRATRRGKGLVFIAGMPRSGTTLIEQIIDAHPEACGVGEEVGIQEIAGRLQVELDSYDPYPECVGDLREADIKRLAERYLAGLPQRARKSRLIVNKHLENYRHLGLIALLFPAARIIHCRRDPLDTCLSCYMSDILPTAHPWISDLADIGLAYRQYERLMDYWGRVLDLQMLEVRYEAVIQEPQGWTRRLLEFCGLDFDERCLEFHRSGRAVLTLSYDQVRQPIYRSSVGRHKHYENHLAPLRKALGGHERDAPTIAG